MGPVLRWALLLFAVALALRLLFWQAGPDEAWPYSFAYKGDAVVWMRYAYALQHDQPFERGFPLRPPGMAYLLALLWNGEPEGLWFMRLLGCCLGALIAPVLYLVARGSVGERPALFAGGFTALATGPVLLSSSLNNEVPYLLLVCLCMVGLSRLRSHGRWWHLLLWSALQAATCLLRVEHVLFYGLCLLWLAFGWWRLKGQPARPLVRVMGRCGLSLLVCFLVTLPWHLQAWKAIETFNEKVNPPLPRARLSWSPDARKALGELPGFTQASNAQFLEACVRHRGRQRVEAEDLEILREAYGSMPRALAAHPFIALYGPLNFYLGNNAHAKGGFGRAALAEPPPLGGGRDRYPPNLIESLPLRENLAMEYPPHLQMVNEGYAMGLSWIGQHPLDWLGLAGKKLSISWTGAAHGLGGYALPLGLSGLRRRVDILVPEGILAWSWRLLLAALSLFGLWKAMKRPATHPWLLWLLSRLLITVFFFGYARHGALLVPVVGLLLGLLLEKATKPHLARWGLGFLLAMVCVECARWLWAPEVFVDEQKIENIDPWPADQHLDRKVELR